DCFIFTLDLADICRHRLVTLFTGDTIDYLPGGCSCVVTHCVHCRWAFHREDSHINTMCLYKHVIARTIATSFSHPIFRNCITHASCFVGLLYPSFRNLTARSSRWLLLLHRRGGIVFIATAVVLPKHPPQQPKKCYRKHHKHHSACVTFF